MKLSSLRRIFLNRRVLSFEALLLLGIVGALFAHRWHIDREIARLSDELRARGLPATWPELETWYATPPPAENAWLLYEQALSISENEDPDLVPYVSGAPVPPANGTPPPGMLEAATAYLDKHAAALALLHTASRMPQCLFPLANNYELAGAEAMGTLYTFQRAAARLLCVEAFVAMERGDFPRAVAALESGAGMVRQLHAYPDSIAPLVALAMQSMLAGPAERLLQDTDIDGEALARLQVLLLAQAEPPDLSAGVLGNGIGLVTYQQEIMEDPPVAGFALLDEAVSLDEPTQTAIADVLPWAPKALGWLATATRFHAREELSVLRQVIAQLPFTRLSLDELADAEAPGIIFGPLQLSALDGVMEVTAGQCTHARVLAASYAVRRYQKAHGHWPARMEDLTPEYLDHPLLDPYSKQPLRYLPTPNGFTLYSIGDDRTDNNGQPSTQKRARFREIAFSYPPRPTP